MKHVFGVMSAAAENPSRPFPLDRKWFYTIAIGGLTLLTVAAAKVAVPLPGTPVPATLQTLTVLLAGLLLGARPGSLSQAGYVTLGLVGLPVFALPGAGPAYLLGPTGGYLLGFIAAAWLVGALAPPAARPGFLRCLGASLAGVAVIHALGVLWLALLFSSQTFDAIRAGSLPFLGFDLAKGVLASAVVVAFRSMAGRTAWTNRTAG